MFLLNTPGSNFKRNVFEKFKKAIQQLRVQNPECGRHIFSRTFASIRYKKNH